MTEQAAKFRQFKALHAQPGAFMIPNPWDAGSAKLLASLGFPALATTSAGLAFAKGRPDDPAGLGIDQVLANAAEIVAATALPVSADLGNGFAATAAGCAGTIRRAAACGLVGGSIEDATGDATAPILDLSEAVERVQAAAEAARDLPFLLTARAENFLWHRPDLDDTIRRLQAYAQAGAQVLYAPGLPDLEAIRTVCASLDKPVNVVMGLRGPSYSMAELAEAGVRRVSVGGSFARAALGGLMRAARELRAHGTFGYTAEALPGAEIERIMRQ